MKIGPLLFALFALAACASNQSESRRARAEQQDDPSKGIICTYTKPVDSFIKERKCTTPEEREAERRRQETMMDVRNERDSGI